MVSTETILPRTGFFAKRERYSSSNPVLRRGGDGQKAPGSMWRLPAGAALFEEAAVGRKTATPCGPDSTNELADLRAAIQGRLGDAFN